MNKEVNDALHTLLSMALENEKYTTQKEQYDIVYKEIERLTELCNKYEEEHKTTFETWQKDIKENERLHSIIKETREYIEEHIKYECDNAFNGMQFYSYHLYNFNKNKLLEILDKVGEE